MMGGRFAGNANELVDAYGALAEIGVERFYVWFTDFADPRTLEAFGATVIASSPAALPRLAQVVRPASMLTIAPVM